RHDNNPKHTTEFHICGNCFSLSGSTTGGCCPLGWTVFESNCYFFSSDSRSWNQSRDWCQTQQAHLQWVRQFVVVLSA
uniref:C-type lectin domain-containing protein n=1 Tax=Neolamprologus brichardi TaxID=32507 RepID=A0A3Q4M7J8_NEOBR